MLSHSLLSSYIKFYPISSGFTQPHRVLNHLTQSSPAMLPYVISPGLTQPQRGKATLSAWCFPCFPAGAFLQLNITFLGNIQGIISHGSPSRSRKAPISNLRCWSTTYLLVPASGWCPNRNTTFLLHLKLRLEARHKKTTAPIDMEMSKCESHP